MVQSLKNLVALGLLVTTASAWSYSDNPGRVVDIATGQTDTTVSPAVMVTSSLDSQVVCLDRKRTGTRIKKRECRTVAAWKTQLEGERLQVFLLQF